MSFSVRVKELIYRIKDRVRAEDHAEARVAAYTLTKAIHEHKLRGSHIPKAFIDFTIEFLWGAQKGCKDSLNTAKAFSGKNDNIVGFERDDFELRLQFIYLTEGFKDFIIRKNSDVKKLTKFEFDQLSPEETNLKGMTDFAYKFGQYQAASGKRLCIERGKEYFIASHGEDARLSDSKIKTLLLAELFNEKLESTDTTNSTP